jgi:hypothetical protein
MRPDLPVSRPAVPVPEPIFTTLEQGFESMLRTVLGRIAQVDADVARGGFVDAIELKRLTDMAVSLRDAMGTSGAPSDTCTEEGEEEDDAGTRARRWLTEAVCAELSDEGLEEVVVACERAEHRIVWTEDQKNAWRAERRARADEEQRARMHLRLENRDWWEWARKCTCQPPLKPKAVWGVSS